MVGEHQHERAGRPGALGALGLAAVLAGISPAAGMERFTVPPASGTPSSSMATAADDQLAARQRRQLAVFGPILLNPSPDIQPETRRQAAAEMLAMGLPEALAILADALASNVPASVTAVMEAVHEVKTIESATADRLTRPAVLAVLSAPADSLSALAPALTRFGPPATELLAEAAQADRSAAERLNAVYALGAFRSREAAAHLIRLLRRPVPGVTATTNGAAAPRRDEPLPKAVIESLERLTGLSHGGDPQRWIAWWNGAAGLSNEDWFAFMANSLNNRVVDLQRQLQEQRQASEQISRELFAAYRDLYPALPIDEQMRRLPRLLDDKLAAVREFGLSRVGVLLRDSVRIPPEVQELAARRLNDESPALRLQAAKLLDELNYPGTSAALAARLRVEQSPDVVKGLLEVLAKRPSEAGLAAAQFWLAHATLSEPAANALWRIMPAVAAPSDRLAAMRQLLREELDAGPQPGAARLLAWMGEETDVATLVGGMDSGSLEMRRAIAEGLLRRGLRQPLLDRAGDEVVYPFAVQAIADGPADLGTFGMLAGMIPSEANRRAWAEAMLKLASHLPPAELLAADDILAAVAYADVALRRAVLLPAARAGEPALLRADRLKAMVRVTPMLLDAGEYVQAWELLETAPDDAESAVLRPMRFQAAALAGRFDQAARLEPQPQAWIALLASTHQRDRRTAMQLHDEIAQRFQKELSAAERATLNEIGDALRQGSASAEGDDAG